MDYAIPYAIWRFFYRIAEFFRDWYVVSAYTYSHALMRVMRRMDRVLAFKITLQNLFTPLYGDRSLAGRVMAFPFRLLRLLIGGIIYLALLLSATLLYLIWVSFPIVLIYEIFS